jgi:hypothetical protein
MQQMAIAPDKQADGLSIQNSDVQADLPLRFGYGLGVQIDVNPAKAHFAK